MTARLRRIRTVGEDQYLVHVVTEALAVGVFAPWLLSQSTNPALSKTDRTFAFVMGAGTIIIDGWLLIKNLRKYRR